MKRLFEKGRVPACCSVLRESTPHAIDCSDDQAFQCSIIRACTSKAHSSFQKDGEASKRNSLSLSQPIQARKRQVLGDVSGNVRHAAAPKLRNQRFPSSEEMKENHDPFLTKEHMANTVRLRRLGLCDLHAPLLPGKNARVVLCVQKRHQSDCWKDVKKLLAENALPRPCETSLRFVNDCSDKVFVCVEALISHVSDTPFERFSCVLLHAAHKGENFIEQRLRWRSNSFMRHLRDVPVLADQHTAALQAASLGRIAPARLTGQT